jgi:hypothetical protein
MTSLEFSGGLMSIEPGIPALGEHVDMQGGVHAGESMTKGRVRMHTVCLCCALCGAHWMQARRVVSSGLQVARGLGWAGV